MYSKEEVIEKARKIHGNKYDYSKVNFKKVTDKVIIICPEHGEFIQEMRQHYRGQGCPKCGVGSRVMKRFGKKTSVSKKNEEKVKTPIDYIPEIIDFLSTIVDKDEILTNNRSILANGRGLDIVIPSKHIAIEFDGLFWHSEVKKEDRNYHLKKTNECEAKGYQLIHIFEDEWIYKKEICKSRLLHILGVSSEKIFARKCEIKPLAYGEYNRFFEENHIQGNVKASYAYGLYYNDELISAMSFGTLRKNLGSSSKEGAYELLRFANKIGYSVVGGASKLFKHFIKEVNPIEITSYADRRWSIGNLYQKLDFTEDHRSQPNYFYIFGDTRKNRFGFRKDILISKYGCKPEQSEHEFCLSQGWFRIYDCGTIVYKWKREA